jgi:DNA-binding response OmpR family regulator
VLKVNCKREVNLVSNYLLNYEIMKKILIIEDNEDVRENTAEILKLANYDVATAENGKIGVEKANSYEPDVIVCDIMMPELDGYGVLEILSGTKSTSCIPFIFLTAKAEKSDMRKGMNLGADDYITKPFEEVELIKAIESRLNKHDFLKKEFSKNIEGLNEFIDEASLYINLENLTQGLSLRNYKKKEIIFMEGDAAHNLYFIQSGTIKTYLTTESGKEFITGLYGPGSFVGQLSLLSDKSNYIEAAIVLDEAEICEISKEDFIKLIYDNNFVSNKFIKMISNNLIDLQEKLINMAFATVRQKTAKALLDLNENGILIDKRSSGINISREDFAGLIGTATETAIRMLTQFKQEGLIIIDSRRKIILQDEVRLLHLANYVE